MLRGRESLIRLVGKRRRVLPNRESLLFYSSSSSSSSIQSSLNVCPDKGESLLSYSSSIQSSLNVCSEKGGKVELIESPVRSEIANEDSVCPVCGETIRGNNYSINSHLDVCLLRGTKRKLTQRTLLEMNFCSPSKVQILSPQKSHPVNSHGEGKGILRNGSSFELSDSNEVEEDNSSFESVGKSLTEGICKSPISGNNTDDSNEINRSFIKDEVSFTDTVITLQSLSDVLFETLIVGRKFVDEKELSQGDRILLLRDPLNAKDFNAIKVVSADSEDPKVMGFLPRELAQYMSPLIDKYCLSFEGLVTAVPKTSLEHVPVQLFCNKEGLDQNIENENMELLGYLWKNVQHVTESSKNRQTSTTKYQLNFSVLVREVLQSNSHLFIESERDLLESFSTLTDDSQRLFVRLYTRKGPWFRVSNISYPEILDPQRAIEQLSGTGYMHYTEDTNKLSFDHMSEILKVLNVAELREIMSVLKQRCNCGTRKQDVVVSLLSSYRDGMCPTLQNLIFERTGGCVRISTSAESLFWRVERLFFLNGEQDLSSFLLVDLGIIKYPTYNCIITEPIFSARNDLLEYEESIEVAQMIDEALDEHNKELVVVCIKIAESRISNTSVKETGTISESSVTFRSPFSASWVYSKILTLGVSFLEHERRYNEAIVLLKFLLRCVGFGRRRGYWILRLSIDLEHIGYHDESLSVAENGLQDTWVRAGSRMALQRRILRLAKPPRRWKTPSFANSVKRKIKEVHVQGRPLNCVTGAKSRFYGEDGEQCGVEQLALQYYAGEGGEWQGVHTESGIWLTIFGLLLWDVIFSDVPNVFRTKFQTCPLDLDTDSFYLTRKSEIESHLARIEAGMGEEIAIRSWQTRLGTSCRGVKWDPPHSLSDLRAIVACVGGSRLASLCRHLAQDYRSWSSGMPDLLLWRFHGSFGPEAKLVEVKGPNDRLSEQQRAWILLLVDSGFNVEVCKVNPGKPS